MPPLDLEKGLAEKWDTETSEAWTSVYSALSDAMIRKPDASFCSVRLPIHLSKVPVHRTGPPYRPFLIVKKKFNFIDLVLMLPAVIALIYGIVSIT